MHVRHRIASLWLHFRLLTRHNKFVFSALFCQFLLLFLLIHMLATATASLSRYLTPDTNDVSFTLLTLGDEQTPGALRAIDGVDAVGYTAATDTVLDGRGCRLITYDPALRPLRHALAAGEWFDERYAEECVLGHALSGRYAVGDTITLWDEDASTPLTLRVAGILPPESYALTCAVPGDTPSLSTALERESTHAPFVLRMATPPETPRPRAVWVISSDNATAPAERLRPFGTPSTLDELTARARMQSWTQNRSTATGLGFVFVLALFLCACSALLSFQQNRHTYAVLAMVGERRAHLLAAMGGIYALLVTAALVTAPLLLRWPWLNARLLDGMPEQPLGYAVCAAVALLGVGACFGLTALLTHRSPLALYRQSR